MAAWIEDAQIIDGVKDLNKNRSSILQRTADVEDFLLNDKLASVILVAPKGFGKTLMLKLKRLSLQEDNVKCLPQGIIVDRPKDRPPILPSETLDLIEKSENWETLWQLSISIAIITCYREELDVKPLVTMLMDSPSLNNTILNIMKDSLSNTPFEILHQILTSSRSDLFDIIRSTPTLTSIYSRIRARTAVFIDNVDEYLEHYINYE